MFSQIDVVQKNKLSAFILPGSLRTKCLSVLSLKRLLIGSLEPISIHIFN